MNSRSLYIPVLASLFLGACSSAETSGSRDQAGADTDVTSAVTTPAAAAAKEYIDVTSYLTSDADIEAWYTLVANLKHDFDDVCGDTFCEGEFSNIESLRYRCSVEKTAGTLGTCVWIFAASNEEITLTTGNVTVDTQTWRCKTPLAKNTPVRDFLSALAGDQPIRATLPGTTQSIYDGLGNCL